MKISGGRDVPLETRKPRVDAKAEQLAALGGTVLLVTDAPEASSYYMVMQDPEGNEFCVIWSVGQVVRRPVRSRTW